MAQLDVDTVVSNCTKGEFTDDNKNDDLNSLVTQSLALDLSKFSKNEVLRYLQKLQTQLPQARKIVVVEEVKENLLKIMLDNGQIKKLDFKNASWARPQNLQKDKNDKVNFFSAPQNFDQQF